MERIFRCVQFELDVTERLFRSNAAGFSFIFFGRCVATALHAPLPLPKMAEQLFDTSVCFFWATYTFEIVNQTTSPDEDRTNKPYRPIPAGLITTEQAKARWLLAWTVGPAVIHLLSGWRPLWYAFQWELMIYLCYVWPRWSHWFMRNAFAALANYTLQRLLNSVLARSTESWGLPGLIDVTTTGWFMCTSHVQEFHDVEGDRRSAGRKTLPMLLSPEHLRILRAGTAVYIIAHGLSLLYGGYQAMDRGALVVSVCILQQVMSCILAFRVWRSTSPAMDKVRFERYYYSTVLMIQLSLILVYT